ncbi:hypothetical protein ACPCDX_23780 [Streptomyces koyangensis]|uniref:hypothetical protein n=1 Tax=Streptomyces koyangensis TaxID=188770 RepID=UPI003C2AD7A9
MGEDISLSHASELVADTWLRMVTEGEFSQQTYDKYTSLLLDRFRPYATLRGAVTQGDVSADIAEDFVRAPGRSRHGQISEAAVATMRLRRSVVRSAWRILRELALSQHDPTRDIVLPPREAGASRPLTADEVVDLRHQASYVGRPSRYGAAAALALAGAHTGEIGHIRVKDLDLPQRRVWVHGSSKTDARWCALDTWATKTLEARAAFVTARQVRPAFAICARLAVSDRSCSDAQMQARACMAVHELLKRIGLGQEEDVRPASVTAWAAEQEFDRTGRIQDAARLVGVRSLDRAASMIALEWRPAATQDKEEACA